MRSAVSQIGKLLVIIGILLVILGLLLWVVPGLFRWFGKLPGDIVIRRDGFVLYAPITSMLLLSLLISLVLGVLSRIMR